MVVSYAIKRSTVWDFYLSLFKNKNKVKLSANYISWVEKEWGSERERERERERGMKKKWPDSLAWKCVKHVSIYIHVHVHVHVHDSIILIHFGEGAWPIDIDLTFIKPIIKREYKACKVSRVAIKIIWSWTRDYIIYYFYKEIRWE